jgi:glyoxalase family protein
MKTTGLHHVTAMASDPQRNVDFYSRVLALRLVKKTVNFDDPSTYHFYYGDDVGSPGSIMTFFPWPGARRGRPGSGQVYSTAFEISAHSIDFWKDRLSKLGVAVTGPTIRFGDQVLSFTDPDGLLLELVGVKTPTQGALVSAKSRQADVPAEHAIRGFFGITIAAVEGTRTRSVLTDTLGYSAVAAEGGRTRLSSGSGAFAGYVDLLVDKSIPRGSPGAGTVHHVAFRTPSDATQQDDREILENLGYSVSPIMDRNYFHSIYFREPEGVLFEIATDSPGFAVDEDVEQLGSSLKLPTQYEPHRAQIEAVLPKLNFTQ